MRRLERLSPWIVILVAVVVHARGLGATWVYDDHRFVVQNPALEHVDPVAYFVDPATASAAEGIQHDVYRPLRTLDYAWNRQVFGTAPFGWHLVNVLLHALAAGLLFLVLRPLVRGWWPGALAGAVLFAVHPVTVECVAWVSSRGDLLALVLMLAALLVLERRGLARTALGALLATLAVFAKESALVLPALLLLRDLALPREGAPGRRESWARVAVLGAVCAAYLAVRLSVIPGLAQVDGFPGGSRESAARGFFSGLAWYAQDLLLPLGFPFDLHLPVPLAWSDPEVVLGLGLGLTIVLAGLWGAWRGRWLLVFAALGSLACLVPVSNVLVPLKALVAERFLYPVLVCVAVGVAGGLVAVSARYRKVALAAVLVACVPLAVLTWTRTASWADDLTLWERVLRERPDHMRAYEGLGFEYARQKRVRDAILSYESYLEYNPLDAKSRVLLGDLYGSRAQALRLQGQPGVQTDVGRKRHEQRRRQLLAYGHALLTWERVGLVAGRGSDELVAYTLGRVMEAAFDLGDLPKVKEANDVLLGREGVDATDVEAVFDGASFPRRRIRVDIAFQAVATGDGADLPDEERRRRMAQRATLLRDVGISPRLVDAEVLRRILPLYRALAAEAPARAREHLDVRLQIVAVLQRIGDEAALRREIEALEREFPGDRRVGRLR